MKEITKKEKIAWAGVGCMILAGAGHIALCRNSVAYADWYAGGPFQLFPNVIGRITGLLPFSLYEILLYLLAAGLLVGILWGIFRRVRPERTWICGLVCFVSFVFCMASFTCLGNYGRSPLADFLGIQVGESSVEDLKKLCTLLVEDAVSVMDRVERDEEGTFTVGDTDLSEEARKAMNTLGETYAVFEGYYPPPKAVLFSEGMSYLNLTGMYSPFTIEANYNGACTDYLIPYTICHELGHLRGFMREDEAGFIAWLACYHSENPAFQYSGAVSALKYGLNALYRELEYEEYKDFYNEMPEEIRWDLWKNSEYWNAHRGLTYTVGTKVNDAYLKVNAQEGGTKSYGRMIDLLMAYRNVGADPL